MKYSEAVRELSKIMKERPDIETVKFNRDTESFDVISGNTIHMCLLGEFEAASEEEIDNKSYYVIQNDEGGFFHIGISNTPGFNDDLKECERYNTAKAANDFLNSEYANYKYRYEFKGAVIRKVVATVEPDKIIPILV